MQISVQVKDDFKSFLVPFAVSQEVIDISERVRCSRSQNNWGDFGLFIIMLLSKIKKDCWTHNQRYVLAVFYLEFCGPVRPTVSTNSFLTGFSFIMAEKGQIQPSV